MAVFSFNSIILGPEVKVNIVGQRAFSLVSKTTAIINTTFEAVPGQVGGMQGGGSVARYESDFLTDTSRDIYICDIGRYCANGTTTQEMRYGRMYNESFVSNNVNGLGSGSLRVYPFVVTTSADDFREIQVITTSAQTGQTLAGGFKLFFNGYSTPIIPHDCSSNLMKEIIENNLNLIPPSNAPITADRTSGRVFGVGEVSVSRSPPDSQEGFVWSITFGSYIGNMAQMTYTNYLRGLGNDMTIQTYQDGNEVGGTFTLTFQGNTTLPIAAAESAVSFKSKLLSLPSVSTAFVSRIDPTENCDDGLCVNGPHAARGLVWSCFVTTDVYEDNISPTSPTSPLRNVTGEYYRMVADYTSLSGNNSAVGVSFGMHNSPNTLMAQLLVQNPFSLAYGGGGGSYGGVGGAGYSENPTGYTYNDDSVSDLLGGSGGAMRGEMVFEINAAKGRPTGLGGDGGGAIEIIAANDIVLGSHGRILVDGANGEQSSQGGGGGGSGGAVVLAAGGTVVNQGFISAAGGIGGFGGFDNTHMNGGGGGGGRVALFGESVQNLDGGVIVVDGGLCGGYTLPVYQNVVRMNISVHTRMRTPLDQPRASALVSAVVNSSLTPAPLIDHVVQAFYAYSDGYYLHSEVNLTVIVASEYNSTQVNETHIQPYRQQLNDSVGVNIAEVEVLSANVSGYEYEVVTWISDQVTYPAACSNDGNKGTFRTETLMQTSM